MTALPRVSICLPVRQGAHLVRTAIEGALSQEEQDWELIIGDNASTDGLREVVEQFDDPRIMFHRWDAVVDVHENFNRTMELARSDWVLPLGADDRLRPHALRTVVEAATAVGTPPCVMVVGRCHRVLRDGSSAEMQYYGSQRPVIPRAGSHAASAWLQLAATGGPFVWNLGSVLFSRAALAESGPFRPEVGLAADMELIFRAAALGTVAVVDATLVDVMVRDESEGNQRWLAHRRDGDPQTPLARAIVAALEAHAAVRSVSAAERQAVMNGAARTQLVRAAQHRVLPGGRGRIGSLADIREALRLSPRTVLRWSSWTLIVGALLAPRWLIRFASTMMQRCRHRGSTCGLHGDRPGSDRTA
ncbi:MAG: glycosyltransferase family 2 protein [Candidatus Limnocylindria bacterium]